MLVMMPENRAWLLFGVYIGVLTLTWLPSTLGAVIVYIVHRVRTQRSRQGN
jgi:hypothetical protein